MEALVPFSTYLDDIPRPMWIAAMILGFALFWPVGMVMLAYLIGSGRLKRRGCGPGRWYNDADRGFRGWGSRAAEPAPSSNRAFDDYRAETLRRLEQEQREFMEYLERLRQARDKAEFDAFMAERRRGAPPPDSPSAS